VAPNRGRYDDFKGENGSIPALGGIGAPGSRKPVSRFLDQLRWFPDVLETLNNGTSL